MKEKKKVILTPKQVRSMLEVSLSHIYNLLRDPANPIPHYRVGNAYRIDEEEFIAWLDSHHVD